MKILMGRLNSFNGIQGGIERVCARMANEFSQRGYQVGVIFNDRSHGVPFYPVSHDVKLFNISGATDKPSKFSEAKLKLMRELVRPFSHREAMKWKSRIKVLNMQAGVQKVIEDFKPDMIISFDPSSNPVFDLFAGKGKPIRLISMFHFPVEKALDWENEAEVDSLLKSDCVQTLTMRDLNILRGKLPGVQGLCIPNAIPQYETTAALDKPKKEYKIIDVARLEPRQKRQHLLIEAFALLADEFPSWVVELWGVESRRQKTGMSYTQQLRKLIDEKHLEQRVFLKGSTSNVLAVYQNSDIFGFPSSFEGFSLALGEAMSAGLPAIGMQKCAGVNEVIIDGKTGFLVEDSVEALAERLRKLMGNQELRTCMGKAAHLEMKQYSSEAVWDKWDKLIKSF